MLELQPGHFAWVRRYAKQLPDKQDCKVELNHTGQNGHFRKVALEPAQIRRDFQQ